MRGYILTRVPAMLRTTRGQRALAYDMESAVAREVFPVRERVAREPHRCLVDTIVELDAVRSTSERGGTRRERLARELLQRDA